MALIRKTKFKQSGKHLSYYNLSKINSTWTGLFWLYQHLPEKQSDGSHDYVVINDDHGDDNDNKDDSRSQHASGKLTASTPLIVYTVRYTCTCSVLAASCSLVLSTILCAPLYHPTPVSHFVFINVVFCNSPLCKPCFALQAKTQCNILYVYETCSQNLAINYFCPNMLRSHQRKHIYK